MEALSLHEDISKEQARERTINLFDEVVSPTLPEASTAILMRCQVVKSRGS